MMIHWAKLSFLCIAIVIVLFACGGGGGDTSANGGDADTMTVQVSTPQVSGAIGIYTEGAYNSLGYLDPNLSSEVTASGNTYVSLCSGVTSTSCGTQVTIAIKGNTVQSYPTGTMNSPTQITYRSNNDTYSSIYSSTIGSISLSRVGVSVGEFITGSFEAEVALMTNPTTTRLVAGTFSVKRNH